ncbi:hypothetical protein F4814DRAFT_376932 [Daldinia grandis]|nr:hypothetical protein F4814DRAFT_376932 [Daldinia grandis]
MDSEEVHPDVCAQLPICQGLAKQLVEGLDNGDALETLFPLVVGMAGEWRNQTAVPISKTIGAFENDGEEAYGHLRVLFHTFNRKTLRSLLLGTLPHDLYDKDSPKWENIYSPGGPGAYVVSISIEDRRGAFLSRNETEKLISRLRDYKAGCVAWCEREAEDALSQEGLSPAQKSALSKALSIDNMILSDTDKWLAGDEYTQPRCLEENIGNMDELIAMFGRRVDAQFDEEVHQISCPVHVGCGRRVPSRLLQHNPDHSSMSQSSNTLKLLVSCILHIGLQPVVHTVPMVMVWEEFQVPLAEMLVTVLAQSLVTIHGLNVAQPGTSSASSDDNKNVYFGMKKHVWLERPWFMANVEKSLAVGTNRDVYCNAVEEIQESFLSDAELNEYVAGNEELEASVERLYAKVHQILDEREAEQERMWQRLAEDETFYQASRALFAAMINNDEDDNESPNESSNDSADLPGV